jgi:subtilisin family serine protease
MSLPFLKLARRSLLALAIATAAIVPHTGAQQATQDSASGSAMYIIGLKSPPLAMYRGDKPSYAAAARKPDGKLDIQGPAASRYVQFLQAEQTQFFADASTLLGRSSRASAPEFQFQHAFNGVVMNLTEAEAQRIKSMPNVALVEAYREYELLTDAGPALIGAPTIWNGTNTANGFRSRGEGIVIGVIDSGANLGSPSFADVDIDGFDHTNPLGTGNYLGWCNPTNPNYNAARDVCSDKIIGGWDFTDTVFPAGNTEATGFEDENGHGSHTASTAAGSRRNATILGAATTISGVAPRANLVIYDACYTETATGRGLCPNVSTLASINQAVADGAVDVINYSISGGEQPWTTAQSLAFLSAQNAGIFVAASAGNSGPGPGTIAHNEPWVTTVGNSTHDRSNFGFLFNATGPTPVPTTVQNLQLRSGAIPPVATPIPLPLPTTTPIIVSPTIGVTNDGCAAYPAGTFLRGIDRAIAVVRWSATAPTCGTTVRANNAITAGAAVVIFAPDTALNAAGGANAPVFVVINNTVDNPNLIAFVNANAATATASIPATAVPFPGTPDVMNASSSRGPNPFNFLKPDVTNPGTNVLAAVSRWAVTPAPGALIPTGNNNVNLLTGTSMSSPHTAGAAALLKAVNRAWTPMQIKSALMMTAKNTGIFKENGTTPSDPFDRGAGRVDLNVAAKAGLLMNETGVNFSAANPATGGNPSTLNIPSFQNPACVGTCTFTRTVTGTTASAVTWTASVSGLPAGSASVTPASFSVTGTASATFSLNVDATLLAANTWLFGSLTLTPSVATIPVVNMPIAIRAAAPTVNLIADPAGLNVTLSAGGTTTRQLTVANTGNPTLNWALADTPRVVNLLTPPAILGTGFQSAVFAAATPANTGAYAADDFDMPAPGSVQFIRSEGFLLPSGNLGTVNSPLLNFRVYADNNGVPAGGPEAFGAAAVWEYQVAPTAAGVNIVGNSIQLDLVAAGAPTLNLAGGKYWVVVYPSLIGDGSRSSPANPAWFWRITGAGAPSFGLPPQLLDPTPAAGAAAWTVPQLTGAPGPGPAAGFATTINGQVACGAPWLSSSVTNGALGIAGTSVATLTLTAGPAMMPGTYRAAVCVTSNDPARPTAFVPVVLTVVNETLFRNGFEDPVR